MKRQGFEYKRIQHRKNSRIRADAKRKCDNDCQGEPGILAKYAECVTSIQHYFLNERQTAGVAMQFSGRLDTPKPDYCLPSGFLWPHSRADILLGRHVDMGSNLFIKIVIQFPLAEYGKNAPK